MDLEVVEPDLFFTRFASHLCAPTFVFLSGMAAWLYAHPRSGGFRSPTHFLWTRGLVLILLEVTLINTSWLGEIPPETLWLQVIWAIGLSMIALAFLSRLPSGAILAIGLVIVFGHNLLTPIAFEPGTVGNVLWTVLHEPKVLESGIVSIEVIYPVLPWIGVILLGYAAGPLYSAAVSSSKRVSTLLWMGAGSLLLALLRGFNLYGETLPWAAGETFVQSLMSFLNFTKYPPSLSYLLLTLGVMFFFLASFEKLNNAVTRALDVFGKAPMFIYALHLYVLLFVNNILLAVFGPNRGDLFAVDHLWMIWAGALLMAFALYFPVRTFAKFKHSTPQRWVRYF